MPGVKETIISEEDRTFTSSMGNWTGDGEWVASAPPLGLGVARLRFEPGETDKSMQLSYPYIKPEPNKTHAFSTNFLAGDITEDVEISYSLTDGVYEFSGSQVFTVPGMIVTIDDLFVVPEDFDETASYLLITATTIGQATAFAVFSDRYSLTYDITAKKQHLPIMGVG